MQVAITPEALQDLDLIRQFVALQNPYAAAKLAARLLRACESLAFLPARGRLGAVFDTRELVSLRPYIIVYTVYPDRIDILRIWHAAQSRRSDPP